MLPTVSRRDARSLPPAVDKAHCGAVMTIIGRKKKAMPLVWPQHRPNARFCAIAAQHEAPDTNPGRAGRTRPVPQQKQGNGILRYQGSTEMISRMIADKLSHVLGSVISVISKP